MHNLHRVHLISKFCKFNLKCKVQCVRKIQSIESFSDHCSKSYITSHNKGRFSKQIKNLLQKMIKNFAKNDKKYSLHFFKKVLCTATILADPCLDVFFNYSCQCKAYRLLGPLFVGPASWKLAHFCWHRTNVPSPKFFQYEGTNSWPSCVATGPKRFQS